MLCCSQFVENVHRPSMTQSENYACCESYTWGSYGGRNCTWEPSWHFPSVEFNWGTYILCLSIDASSFHCHSVIALVSLSVNRGRCIDQHRITTYLYFWMMWAAHDLKEWLLPKCLLEATARKQVNRTLSVLFLVGSSPLWWPRHHRSPW